jgi:hypothetical protein
MVLLLDSPNQINVDCKGWLCKRVRMVLANNQTDPVQSAPFHVAKTRSSPHKHPTADAGLSLLVVFVGEQTLSACDHTTRLELSAKLSSTRSVYTNDNN